MNFMVVSVWVCLYLRRLRRGEIDNHWRIIGLFLNALRRKRVVRLHNCLCADRMTSTETGLAEFQLTGPLSLFDAAPIEHCCASTVDFNAQRQEIVAASQVAGASINEVAERFGVRPNLLTAWRRRAAREPAMDSACSQSASSAVDSSGRRRRAVWCI
jgi:Transposase